MFPAGQFPATKRQGVYRAEVRIQNGQPESVIISTAGDTLGFCQISALQADIADAAQSDGVRMMPPHGLPQFICHPYSDPDDIPDVIGGGQNQNQAGEKDHRPCPLELSMLLIVKIRHP